jgi:ribosome-binding factor A
MSEARSRRIESEIQRVLAALIAREVKDPRVGNVTITAVHVAADMGTARIYFTPFASRLAPEQVRQGLTHAASFLRGELGRRLSLRHAPRLEFLFDASAEGAARLTSLIDRAVAADRAAHGGEAAGEGSAGGTDDSAADAAGAADPRR